MEAREEFLRAVTRTERHEGCGGGERPRNAKGYGGREVRRRGKRGKDVRKSTESPPERRARVSCPTKKDLEKEIMEDETAEIIAREGGGGE